ncbi:MAG: hypothetical protein QXL18_05220 [Candidatus Woesearchaeota archaeon]
MFTRQEIDKDFQPHWNKYHTFNIWSINNEQQDNGNALGYTAHYYSILYRNNLITDNDKKVLISTVDFYWIRTGLLNRHPHNPDYQAFDDYEFISHAGHVTGVSDGIAGPILKYGRRNFWYFNNAPKEGFNLKCWFARRPGFVAHIKICANKKPNIFDRIMWCIGLISNANEKYSNTSGKIRRFMMIRSYEKWKKDNNKSFMLMDYAVNYWRNKMRKMYPNGLMGEVISIYFKQIPWMRKYYEGEI